MTSENFCLYLQNRLIQTSQTGGQWYSDTPPFSIPWFNKPTSVHLISVYDLLSDQLNVSDQLSYWLDVCGLKILFPTFQQSWSWCPSQPDLRSLHGCLAMASWWQGYLTFFFANDTPGAQAYVFIPCKPSQYLFVRPEPTWEEHLIWLGSDPAQK